MSETNPYRPAMPLFVLGEEPPLRRSLLGGPLRLLAKLTLLAAAGFNLAMMVAVICFMIAAPLALLWVIAGLFKNDAHELASRVLYLGALLAMLPIGGGVLYAQHALLDLRMSPLVEALEAHKRATGSYPATLEALSQSPPRCNALGVVGERPFYHPHEGSYAVTCVTFGFNHHTYQPAKQRWENWD